jgi:hypothetical protein
MLSTQPTYFIIPTIKTLTYYLFNISHPTTPTTQHPHTRTPPPPLLQPHSRKPLSAPTAPHAQALEFHFIQLWEFIILIWWNLISSTIDQLRLDNPAAPPTAFPTLLMQCWPIGTRQPPERRYPNFRDGIHRHSVIKLMAVVILANSHKTQKSDE